MSVAQAFSESEWALLSGALQLRQSNARDLRSLPARALLDDQVCEQLLATLGPIIGSPTVAITASLLAKRFSFLSTGACLYAMSVYDKGLILSLDNSVVEYAHDDGLWTSSMPLVDVTPVGYEPGTREAWRDMIVATLFRDLLQPLWETFNRVTGISRRILWENTAVRVYSLYDKRMDKVEDPLVRQRYEADFDWLLNQATRHCSAELQPLETLSTPADSAGNRGQKHPLPSHLLFLLRRQQPCRILLHLSAAEAQKMSMNKQIAHRQQQLSDAVIEQFRGIAASTIGHLTDSGYLRGIRPLFDGARLVGNVVTVKVHLPDGSIDRMHRRRALRLLGRTAHPGWPHQRSGRRSGVRRSHRRRRLARTSPAGIQPWHQRRHDPQPRGKR